MPLRAIVIIYTVFTDDAINELFGIISIDESTEWRGGPRPSLKDFPPLPIAKNMGI